MIAHALFQQPARVLNRSDLDRPLGDFPAATALAACNSRTASAIGSWTRCVAAWSTSEDSASARLRDRPCTCCLTVTPRCAPPLAYQPAAPRPHSPAPARSPLPPLTTQLRVSGIPSIGWANSKLAIVGSRVRPISSSSRPKIRPRPSSSRNRRRWPKRMSSPSPAARSTVRPRCGSPWRQTTAVWTPPFGQPGQRHQLPRRVQQQHGSRSGDRESRGNPAPVGEPG